MSWSNIASIIFVEPPKPVVRIGDRHEGTCHGNLVYGFFIQGSEDVFVNNLNCVRVTDEATLNCPDCGGPAIADEGNPKRFVNHLHIHRVGDRVVYPAGEGISVTGSPDTFA